MPAISADGLLCSLPHPLGAGTELIVSSRGAPAMETEAKSLAISKERLSFRGGSSEPNPETMNTVLASRAQIRVHGFRVRGPSTSSGAPAPRNGADRIGRFHPGWRTPLAGVLRLSPRDP